MSSSFVEFAIEDEALRDQFKLDCGWSATGQYLAVSTFAKDQGGSVALLSENGAPLEPEQLSQKTVGKSLSIHDYVIHVGLENYYFMC